MKTTLLTTLLFLAISASTIHAQSDECPKQNKMKEGSCLIINYPDQAAAIKAVSAPAETLIVSESTHEESNGVYIAQFNCTGTEVIFTKAGKCSCSDYDGTIAGTFQFTHAVMTCKFDAAGVLPVEFSSFEAEKEGDYTLLVWSTAFESDNEGFYVEKSTDGKFFQEFAFIVGEGNSTESNTYEALDRDPVAGTNYYRLKQVDYNGNERYSDVISVNFRGSGATIVSFNTGSRQLKIVSDKTLQSIEIFDLAGVRVFKGSLNKNENQHTIDLNDQRTGHFIAVITDANGNVESKKFTNL